MCNLIFENINSKEDFLSLLKQEEIKNIIFYCQKFIKNQLKQLKIYQLKKNIYLLKFYNIWIKNSVRNQKKQKY